MSRNIKRVNTTKRKQSNLHEHETAVDEIENEITMLTKNPHEICDQLKSLKALKTGGAQFPVCVMTGHTLCHSVTYPICWDM